MTKDEPLISYYWNKEDMQKLTKKQLIGCCCEYLEELNKTLEELHHVKMAFARLMIRNHDKEVLNDHIGSLQEKIELLHLDLANQIHWRLKLEEELKNGKQ